MNCFDAGRPENDHEVATEPMRKTSLINVAEPKPLLNFLSETLGDSWLYR